MELSLFTEQERKVFETLSEQDKQLFEKVTAIIEGKERGTSLTIQEFLASPTAKILIPKVIIGAVRKGAEPVYLASKLFKKISVPQSGTVITFPAIGPMRAYDLAEGQEYPADVADIEILKQTTDVRIGKVGLRVQVTEEIISESQWDILGLMLEEAGKAMARHKEEKIFRAFNLHGHVVFDNALRAQHPEAGTTGRGEDGNFNDTMSVEDIIDMILAVMANEYTPTDIIMHPLTWSVFAKSALVGGFMLPPELPNASFKLGPESVQGRFPFGFNVLLSPFVPLDREKKRYDMYVVDRDNIGVILQKEDITTEQFDDPYRDIRNIKLRERYGIGILNEGRAIAVARNIALDKTWPPAFRVKQIG